jgi:hypothetical protein
MTLPATAPDPDEDRVVPFPGGAPDTSQPTLDVPLDVKSEQIRLCESTQVALKSLNYLDLAGQNPQFNYMQAEHRLIDLPERAYAAALPGKESVARNEVLRAVAECARRPPRSTRTGQAH